MLICAGDMTNQGGLREMKRFVEWIERMDFEVKVVVGGKLCFFSFRSVMGIGSW